MVNFSAANNPETLCERLVAMAPHLADLEMEELVLLGVSAHAPAKRRGFAITPPALHPASRPSRSRPFIRQRASTRLG
jgi:hypothetical protein